MKFITNALDINYQNWKREIIQLLLYKHFRDQAVIKTKDIKEKMEIIENTVQKTAQQTTEYMEHLDQLIKNCSNVYNSVKENLDNQELIDDICSQKNIDLSLESYKRWLETGEKIKI